MKQEKTNATRMLDRAKLSYELLCYQSDGFMDGVSVAQKLELPVESVFKTLVTCTPENEHYVFVLPVAAELDLKAAAKAVNEKSVSMLHVADITKVTGYVRGGCSPVGMKKQFKTVFDSSCLEFDAIYVSAGRLGCQMKLSPQALMKFINASAAGIVQK